MSPEDLIAFNDDWLAAWSRKDLEHLAELYAPDCTYIDPGSVGGLSGRIALIDYVSKMFAATPAWTYRSDTLWPISGGFCARWYCDMDDGTRLRGFDFVQLRGWQIAFNEVYVHYLTATRRSGDAVPAASNGPGVAGD
jgi:hypothetical protein